MDISFLVKRAKDRDITAFSELYSFYSEDLYRFALYMLNSKEDAEGLLGGLGKFYADSFASSFGGTKDTRKKKAIIQNFPIPNTKEDILEFLTLAVPLAKKPGFFDQDETKREMYPVWKAKCEQIIMKAKFSMKDDPKTLAEILEYGKQLGIE